MVRILVALGVVFVLGCGNGDQADRDPLDEEYCGDTGVSYIVIEAYPHPWNSPDYFGEPCANFSLEADVDPDNIMQLAVSREEGGFDIGDRVCMTQVSSPCEDCYFNYWDDNYYSFTRASVQSGEGSVTCTIESPYHILEEAEVAGYPAIDGGDLNTVTFDRVDVDSDGNEHQIYSGWWAMEYSHEDFIDFTLLDSYVDGEGQTVNVYSYTLAVHQTLLGLKLCDGDFCPEFEFWLETWVDKDYVMGWYPNADCAVAN